MTRRPYEPSCAERTAPPPGRAALDPTVLAYPPHWQRQASTHDEVP